MDSHINFDVYINFLYKIIFYSKTGSTYTADNRMGKNERDNIPTDIFAC